MKNLIYIAIILFVVSCKNEPKNYVEFSGEVQNLEEGTDSVTIFTREGFKRQIAIENCKFKDTINITEGEYMFKIGNEYGNMYLKNNDKLHLTTDYKDFDEQLKFDGTGKSSKMSNVQTDFMHLLSANFNDEIASLPQEEFDGKMEAFKTSYADFKQKNADVDSAFFKKIDEQVDANINGFKQYHAEKQKLNKFVGKDSPTFAMLDINDKMVKLNDLKGKYVYIDVWATWCGPCKREIPALKELEKEYHGKDIVFVSMSIDEAKDKEKWKKFVADNKLSGVQIFAENAWQSKFVTEYEIKGIPRFILVNKEGKIVTADAPRPSSSQIKKLFNGLNI